MLPRYIDYDEQMEIFERKYEAWREAEYEKYYEKQYDLLHAPANIQQQIQSTNDKQIGCRWGKTERCEYRPLSCPECTMTLQTSTKKENTGDNKH